MFESFKLASKKPHVIIATVLAAIIIIGFIIYIGCLIFSWAWNLTLTDLFGWPRITWLHAIAILILIGIIRGSMGVQTKKGG